MTSGVGLETGPVFSPDGTMIAFTGEYDGNRDVYVVPAAGGVPRRLTYHPGPDEVLGWTPDGKQVLFRSRRDSANDPANLFTIQIEERHDPQLEKAVEVVMELLKKNPPPAYKKPLIPTTIRGY